MIPSVDSVADQLNRPPVWKLVVAMIILQAVAAACYPLARYGLQIIEPFTFAFFRYILSSVVLLAIVHSRRRTPPIDKSDWWKIIGLGVVIIPFNQTLFMVGQAMTGAGHGAFLFSTTPVWVLVLAVIHLKEKPSLRRVLGMVLATSGVLLIMWSGLKDVGEEYLWGDLIIVVSVVAWGYYTIFGKPLVRKYGALRMTGYALAIGSALYMPLGLYFALRYDYSQATWGAWGSIVYMALGLSVVVYVLWYWLLKYLDASRIAVYHNVQPVFASLLAFLFLGEPLTAFFIVGGLIVISGVLITEL